MGYPSSHRSALRDTVPVGASRADRRPVPAPPSGTAAPAAMSGGPGAVVVVGASGGVGASSLACAVARRRATTYGTCLLVDLDLGGGGLDVTAGVEHLPGPRWGDLAALAGVVDGTAIESRLPRRGGCAVLSAGHDPTAVRPAASRRPDVLAVLSALPGPMVLDLPRHQVTGDVLALAEHIVVVASCLSRSLSDLDALMSTVPIEGAWWVSRGPNATSDVVDDVCDATGLLHLAHLDDDARLPRRAERGEWPGGHALRRVCDQVAAVTDEAA